MFQGLSSLSGSNDKVQLIFLPIFHPVCAIALHEPCVNLIFKGRHGFPLIDKLMDSRSVLFGHPGNKPSSRRPHSEMIREKTIVFIYMAFSFEHLLIVIGSGGKEII